MTTIVKDKTVTVEFDSGLETREEIIAKIAVLEADMATKKKEHDYNQDQKQQPDKEHVSCGR